MISLLIVSDFWRNRGTDVVAQCSAVGDGAVALVFLSEAHRLRSRRLRRYELTPVGRDAGLLRRPFAEALQGLEVKSDGFEDLSP